MTIAVTIYERVKTAGKWTILPVGVPKLSKVGTLFLKDDRQGRFRISWYENRKKQWMTIRSQVKNSRELPMLSDALRLAESKAWYLNNRKAHRVSDPTTTPDRLTLSDHIRRYLAEKSGCAKTLSAHRLALTEFQAWAQKIQYVDEITKPLLRKFFEYLVDDDEDDGTNTPFTAARR
jgi:hypothetical protein